jgi:uncharacterized protein YbaP (TraB family)
VIRKSWRPFVVSLSLLLGIAWSLPAAADGGNHTFWEVSGRQNKLWLFGSVHLLKDADAALPEVAEQAYGDAETIFGELDLGSAIAGMMGPKALAMQMLPEGQTLATTLGPELYARLKQVAGELSIDTDFMTRYQPWFAALQIQQRRLALAGFNPLKGIDMQIALRAGADGKPMHGLEQVEDQLSLFADLTMAQQREFLRATLDEEDMEGQMQDITRAWSTGNLDVLGKLLREGAEESPELFQKLTTDRNLRWLPQIEKMLQDPRNDYLVVVGALHMVGPDGLVELLRRKGYRVDQK